MRQVALLRGINVGGNKKVGMAELKQMFERMGFGGVQTYINSGNVVFEAGENTEGLSGSIEREIEKTFGFPVSVLLRSDADLERIIGDNPFAGEGTPEELNLHVGFLAQHPGQEKLEKLLPYVTEHDQFRIAGLEMYVMFKAGVRDSKLGNNLQKIGVPVTLRNWNTTTKLAAMAKAVGN